MRLLLLWGDKEGGSQEEPSDEDAQDDQVGDQVRFLADTPQSFSSPI